MPNETDICNLALGKLGGAGDALNGNAFISSIDDTDKVSSWCKLAFPRVRRSVISDLATSKTPFRSTVRFADLGAAISEANRPETGNYTYAFNLPGDCLTVVSQFIEGSIVTRDQRAYSAPGGNVFNQWEVVASSSGTGKILLTDYLTNEDENSAFIEYVIDTPATGGFSEELINCIATLLASEVAPMVGRDMEASNAMLAKYEQIVIPKAKKANVAGFNNSARNVSNYRGGRNRTIGGL